MSLPKTMEMLRQRAALAEELRSKTENELPQPTLETEVTTNEALDQTVEAVQAPHND